MSHNEEGGNARELKSRLRSLVRDRVASMDRSERRAAERTIHERLLALAAEQPDPRVLAFVALRDEVDLDPFLVEMVDRGWDVVVPRIEDGRRLRLARWKPGVAMNADSTGVPAPADGVLLDPADVGGLALVPGRAFDPMGGRVGRGRGYFDGFLTEAGQRWLSIGVAYECQVVEKVPMEEHDRELDGLVTERSYRVFRQDAQKRRTKMVGRES